MEKYPIANEILYLRSPSINVCFRVILEGIYEKSVIEETLTKICIRHPFINCSVNIDTDNKTWLVKNSKPVRLDYFKSDEMDWQTWYQKNDNIPFDFLEETLVMFCVIARKDTELIVLGHHIIADGIGYLNMLKDILLSLDGKIEMIPLIPPHGIDVKDFKKTIPLNMIEKIFARSLNKRWKKSRTRFPENDYRVFFEQYRNKYIPEFYMVSIEDESFKQILYNSKTSGLSVNEIIASAFSLAFMEVLNRKEIRLGVAANIRNELISEPNNCMGNFVTGISVKVSCNRTNDFMTNAKSIASLLKKQLENLKTRHLVLHFLNEFEKDLIESIMFAAYGNFEHPVSKKLAGLIGEQAENKGLGISNLGRQDFSAYTNLKVLDVQFIGPAFPANTLTVGIITVNEKMNLCIRYNKGETKIEDVKILYKKAIELVRQLR